ncbi:putative protein N(5)-glutamine methyltransferase [Luteimicrobium subarcticum]|uniref:putative protein N(5)-glutamine methyltransferase n=1 Tax=Luteimicrobium subarcticum TaxID=620910 RepID=UPI003184114B
MPRRPSGRVTVRQVADASGYAVGTVSRALSGHPAVAPATRDAIRAVAARLGADVPPPPSPDGPVLVRCPYVLDDYFGRVVTAVAEALTAAGRRVVLDTGESARDRGPTETLADDGYAGAVLVLPPEPVRALEDLRARRVPFVVVDPRDALPADVPSVSAAHLTSSRDLTQHLLDLGHRRIGVVSGPPDWLASRARLAGHASALADVGLLPDPSLRRSIHATADEGFRAAGELLDEPGPGGPPTAIVAFNDKAASGVLRAAAERGLRVPDDLSVTGFDDLDLARSTVPPLTTVHQPLEEMGRMAVSLLLRLVAHQPVDALHVSLATQLVVRGSTGTAPGVTPDTSAPVRPGRASADRDAVVARLRAAGCVFAEDEADLLLDAAGAPGALDALVARRVAGEPLEHLLGWVAFGGLRVAVGPGVFVPRVRTQVMADEATRLALDAGPEPTVVELCCGAAAVAAVVRRRLADAGRSVRTHVADVDPVAVTWARRNVGPDARATVGDLYDALDPSVRGRVDVLAVNAPYVPSGEIAHMPPEARDHEPVVALDGGSDGLDVQRRVIAEAPVWLGPGGSVLVESSVAQAPATAALMEEAGLGVRVVHDDDVDGTVVVGTRR